MSDVGRVEWKPNPKQALFLSLPTTIKEAFYGGGAGSGKSDVLLMYGIVHRWHENPRFKQVFLRRTIPELKKEIVPRSRDIYPKFGATFNATDMAWTFPRPDQLGSGERNAGAMIFLGHCEEEKNVHIYDSMEISLFTPDEMTSLTEYIYLYIGFERTRAPKNSNLPAIIRGAGMPGGIGHTFVKKRFVDPFKDGSKIIVGRGGNKRIFIHATLVDNAEHVDPTYSQSLDGRPEAERRAKKFGDWDAYLGQVFDEFRDKKYPDEPENALHVVEPFEIPKYWPRFVIGDWGYAANTWVGFFAISPVGRLYLYRELVWNRVKIEEWAPIIRHFTDRENPRFIRFCKSAGQDRGQEHTIEQQISDALGRAIELTNNSPGSRVAGKMLLHEYLRWRARPIIPVSELPIYDETKAQWLLRNKGLEDYKSYLALFEPPVEEVNLPKYQIFRCSADTHEGHPNCCPAAIDAIKACSYDKPRNDIPAEDVAEFNGDDAYDAQRYACDAADSFFSDARNEFDKVQKQYQLTQQLANNQDFTAFYRNSRMLEAENDNQPKMVQRYHGRRR